MKTQEFSVSTSNLEKSSSNQQLVLNNGLIFLAYHVSYTITYFMCHYIGKIEAIYFSALNNIDLEHLKLAKTIYYDSDVCKLHRQCSCVSRQLLMSCYGTLALYTCNTF